MNFLRKVFLRLTKFRFGKEGFLELRCDACGHVVARKLLLDEFEKYILYPERFENQTCHFCKKGIFSARLMTEKKFRKRYPHYMQGG